MPLFIIQRNLPKKRAPSGAQNLYSKRFSSNTFFINYMKIYFKFSYFVFCEF